MRVVLSLLLITTVAACGGGEDEGTDGPSVVVTSNVLGSIVAGIVAADVRVEVLLPIGADPHEFAPSARQAEAMAGADLLVVNGGGFEAGLDDTIDGARDAGVEVFDLTTHVELLGDDPHVWTDPRRIADAVTALADRLRPLDAVDDERADAYRAELLALDAEISQLLADIPDDRRVLVTNHEVLGYFADRYRFEVIGAVIPSLNTGAQASASAIETLAELIDDAAVPAIFGETSSPSDLAAALAEAAGAEVVVVELFTESLGGPDSGAEDYVSMLRTDARLIHDALT